MFSPDHVQALSVTTGDLLKHGDVTGKYRRRDEMVLGIAVGCAHAGWTREMFIEAVLDVSNAGGHPLRVRRNGKLRSAHEARRDAEWTWDRAVAWIAQRAGVLAIVADLRRRADGWHWPRKTGRTYRLVLEAHFRIVERRGSLVHGGGVREIAVEAEVSFDTVARAHVFLVAEGWLRVHRGSPRGTREAIQWTLTAPTADTITADALMRQTLPGGRERIGHSRAVDIWRPGGLGAAAGRVYGLLPDTVENMARELGINRDTVRYYFRLLKKHGLAVDGAGGIVDRGPLTPDEVAVKLGSTGLKRRTLKRIEQQQRDFDRIVGKRRK
jgi:DNA-binding transcriptional regulator YhcF (GntR family)